jgi:hypothetical protein
LLLRRFQLVQRECLGLKEDIRAGLIVSNPKVMMGKPVIRGTRITVELALEKFAVGHTEDEVFALILTSLAKASPTRAVLCAALPFP